MKIEPELSDLATWHAAFGKWGATREAGMATEELAETITAINHMNRGRISATDEFINELADAFVCNLQIVENRDLWDEFHAALKVSFAKLSAKLMADDSNHRSKT